MLQELKSMMLTKLESIWEALIWLADFMQFPGKRLESKTCLQGTGMIQPALLKNYSVDLPEFTSDIKS